ncbi:MAG: PAS domain S-box protein [Magnetococcales bacterium]|nr:PAS domain S-box protein [Magnetococcales bacterium]
MTYRWIATLLAAICLAGVGHAKPAMPVTAVVLKDLPPLYQTTPDGAPTGFAIDILTAVARQVGLRVNYLPVDNWAEAMEAVRQGRADFIPGAAITPDRELEFLFSETMETVPVHCFVRTGTTEIRHCNDLAGRKVGVILKGAAQERLERLPGVQPVSYPDLETALIHLLSGDVDAMAVPSPAFWERVRQARLEEFVRAAGPPLLENKRGYLLRKNATELLQRINPALVAHTGSAEYLESYSRWYRPPLPYWTVQRVAWTMGGVLALTLALLLWWRFRGITDLNRRLASEIAIRREAEEERDRFFQISPDMLCVLDHAGRFLRVNPAMTSLLGVAREEMIHQPFQRFIHPDDLELTQEAVTRVMSGETVNGFLLRGTPRQGSLLWCEWAAKAHDGKLYAIGRDVGERLRMENHLRLTQSSLENARDPYFWVNAEGRFIQVNAAACQSLDYSWRELLTMAVPDIDPGYPREMWPIHFARIRQAKQSSFETQHQRRDGTVFPVEMSINYVMFEGEEVLFAFARDISERKQAQAVIQEKERRLREIRRLAKVGDWEYDIVADLITWSDETYHIYGIPPGTPLNYALLRERIHPDDRLAHDANVAAWIRDRKGPPFDYRVVMADGSVRYIHGTGLVESDERGKAARMYGSLQDVTERRQAEEARLAQERAEGASRSKSLFLASMSHDIRSPMNAIVGLTDLLLESELSPMQRQYVQLMSNAGENLLLLINDILDLSKIEAGRLELEDAPWSPREVAEKAVLIPRLQAGRKAVAVHCHVDPVVPPWVGGDGGRVRQVLLNLLGNAVKFTERGVVRLEAETALGAKGRPELVFMVKDTGPGISPQDLERIFDPFVQTGLTSKRSDGTGLGLAICRQIAQRMGGTMEAESQEGNGSLFRLRIPLREVDPPEILPIPPEEKQWGETLIARSRILVVDDSEDNRLLVQAYLAPSGAALTFAEDGQEAVERFQTHEFDLILMDLQMPRLDGCEATRRIRRQEKETGRKPIRILALTAHALREEVDKALNAGCDGYITKPVRKRALLDLLGEWLRRDHQAA